MSSMKPGESWMCACLGCTNTIHIIRQPNYKCKAFNLDGTKHICPKYFELKENGKP